MSLDFAECDRARLARDAAYDGRFYTGVHTTGISCRPVYPVRPARFVAKVRAGALGRARPTTPEDGDDFGEPAASPGECEDHDELVGSHTVEGRWLQTFFRLL
jgi:hypothetical protein